MKRLSLLLCLFFLSCSYFQSKRIDNDKAKAFQNGLDLMKQEEYNHAADYWRQFLKKHPVGSLSPSAYYLLARSLEKLGQCHTAIGHYKNAYTLWGASPTKDRARVKLRLAACYIQIDKADRAIAELSEMAAIRNYYSWEDYNIERNALFAIAYAKEKNNELAETHYQLVDKYVSQALKSKKDMDEKWLSELFLQLAKNIRVLKENSLDLEVLNTKQNYLVRILEWNYEPYAKEAYNDLKETYDTAITRLETASFETLEEVKKLEAYKQNRKKMETLVASLNQLLLEFSPAVKENTYIAKTKSWAEKQMFHLQNKINEPLPSQSITKEAQERQNLNPSKPQPKVLPAKKKEAPKKDPNL